MIEIADHERVRVVRLNRPPMNALNFDLVGALSRAVEEALNDAHCDSIVLTGVRGVFSAGIDTREVAQYDAARRADMLRAINAMVLALYGSPKPVIAAISGHMLGGAFVLALACDVRFAAAGSFKLGLTESAAGIPFPAGPLAVVRAELSPVQQRVLALGALTDAPGSGRFDGVIDRIVDAPALIDAALAEARRLSALPAFARVKRQLRGATLDRLTQIVERDDEPLLNGWV
jgi:enoyl-CoA hydratase